MVTSSRHDRSNLSGRGCCGHIFTSRVPGKIRVARSSPWLHGIDVDILEMIKTLTRVVVARLARVGAAYVA